MALIILSPLGLILPGHFKAGSAWAEWGVGQIRKLVGYAPQGMERLSSLWHAPLPEYTFNGWEEKGLPHQGFAYIMSAVAGILVIVVAVFLIGRALAKKDD